MIKHLTFILSILSILSITLQAQNIQFEKILPHHPHPQFFPEIDAFLVRSLDYADIDGDNDTDIIMIGGYNVSTTKLYVNNGDGSFSEDNSSNLLQLEDGLVRFEDIDGDGDPDLSLMKNSSYYGITFYENDGLGNFTNFNLSYVHNRGDGDFHYLDVDNDSDLDIITSGQGSNGLLTTLYLNDGMGTFSLDTNSNFEGLGYSSITSADVDGDNDIDILISGIGFNPYGSKLKMYLNDGQGTFTEDTSVFPLGVNHGSMEFFDMDNDSDFDLAISGYGSIDLYSNDGLGNFVLVPSSPTVDFGVGELIIEDIDGDNDMDIFLSGPGSTSLTYFNGLYKNDGIGNFTLDSLSNFSGIHGGSAIFDLDGDNDLDMFMIGRRNSNTSHDYFSEFYYNDGLGNFAPIMSSEFTPVRHSSVEMADVDGDNDLDIFIMGTGDEGAVSELYFNDGTGHYSADTTYFQSSSVNGDLDFGDIDGDGDLDLLITGKMIPGGEFIKLYLNDSFGHFSEASVPVLDSITGGISEIVDIDNDGDLDLFLSSYSSAGSFSTILLNDGVGNFVNSNDTTVSGIWHGADLAFFDMDGDSDLDLITTGSSYNTNLYKNDGTGSFTEVTGTPFFGTGAGDLDYSDVDLDGDLDLFIAGRISLSFGTKGRLYLNDGLGNFTEFPNMYNISSAHGDVAFSDVDKDGDEDLLIIGFKGDGSYTRLYLNDGYGNLTLSEDVGLKDIYVGAVAFGDIDNDSDEDLLITGGGNWHQKVSNLYRNKSCFSNSVSFGTDTIIACDSYSIPGTLVNYDSSGVYIDTIVNVLGCDSILTIDLTILDSSSDSISEIVCDFYTVPSGGTTYANSGIYLDTLVNSIGCDSILTIDLTILESTSNSIFEVECDSFSLPSGSATIYSTGIYADTLINSLGCDSILDIHLTVLDTSMTEFTAVVCDSFLNYDGTAFYTSTGVYYDTVITNCDTSILTTNLTILESTYSSIIDTSCYSYISPSGNMSYSESGIYNDTLLNVAGCDSIITIDLEILGSDVGFISVSSCDSYLSPSGNFSCENSGLYSDTIQSNFGCDSILTISFTLLEASYYSTEVISCDSFMAPSGEYTYMNSGIYIDTLVNAEGCDSILTIDLNIVDVNVTSLIDTACESYTVVESGNVYTSSGVYEDTIFSYGCDTLVRTFHLHILESTTGTTSEIVCDSLVSPSGNHVWKQSGSFLDTLINAAGCDSIITVDLTIYNPLSILSISSCDSFISPSSNYVWYSNGYYLDTLQSYLGCDSVLFFDLTILSGVETNMDIVSCESYESTDGEVLWTSSGIYYDTLISYIGCDSILIIDLEIIEDSYGSIVESHCEEYTSPSGLYLWTTSGQYTDTIVNQVGCDSILSIELNILISRDTMDVVDCFTYTSPSGLYTWTEDGVYYDTLLNSASCDSIITINLNIGTENDTLVISSCNSYWSPSLSQSWNQSGIYYDTLTTTTGCDSLLVIDLTINESLTDTVNVSTCGAFVSPSGMYTWTNSGTYIDNLVDQNGCDSILIIELIISEITTSCTVVEDSIIANDEYSTYQWRNCSTGMDIVGETRRSFKPSNNGQYEVALHRYNCTDTSECINISNVGLEEMNSTAIHIYPNPSDGKFEIDLGEEVAYVKLRMYTVTGQLLFQEELSTIQTIPLEIKEAAGVYLLDIELGNMKTERFKLIKLK